MTLTSIFSPSWNVLEIRQRSPQTTLMANSASPCPAAPSCSHEDGPHRKVGAGPMSVPWAGGAAPASAAGSGPPPSEVRVARGTSHPAQTRPARVCPRLDMA